MRPGLFTFRTLDDCHAIMAAATQAREGEPRVKAAVIGGGLLGLEAARGLINHGCEVHVIHLASHLMNMQLDPAAGAILRSSMEAMGVTLHLGKLTASVLGDDRVTGLSFRDDTTIECDMVVISAGIQPNTSLAASRKSTWPRACSGGM